MQYYDAFVSSNISPSIRMRQDMQELANAEFSYASTYWSDVEEEVSFGSLKFKKIEARITSLVDAKTGRRINDDYKKIIFKDCSYKPDLGTRYRFDNNIWIVSSLGNIRKSTSSVYITRCNNTLNTQDKYGRIHMEPCYIDYKINSTQLEVGDLLDVPSGVLNITCQLNCWTQNIDVNDRFIIGDDAYKISYRHKLDRRYTFDNGSRKLLSFYANYDNVGPNDNIELQVADYVKHDYVISCDNEVSNQVGCSGRLHVTITHNGITVDEPVTFTTTDESVVVVSNLGLYTIMSTGDAQIVISMKNFSDCKCVVDVHVGEYKEKIEVYPDTSIIKLNNSVVYTISGNHKYNISLKTELPNKYYKFEVINYNSFKIKNMHQSDEPIYIYYNSDDGEISGEYKITLGGIL